MTILIPDNENKKLKAIDASVDKRIEQLKKADFNLFPTTCKKEYLEHLAFMFDLDIKDLDENEARDLLSRALTLKKYQGSSFALKQALTSFPYFSISLNGFT